MKDGIDISMEDYITSLEDAADIRKTDLEEELMKLEKKYCKMTSKFSWLDMTRFKLYCDEDDQEEQLSYQCLSSLDGE